MIPQSFIQDLLSRVDIVDIVESAVPLKRAGANMAACCPFHTEKSPSFTVSPTKQFYHCFGCGAHGTAISFMMEYHGLGFVEAVKELAARVGMVVPAGEADGARQSNASANAHIVEALTRASRFFKDQLRASESAITYLKGRGVTGEIAARFGLGYAPDGWQNLEATFPDYSTADVLVEAGLVIRSDEGRRYDRFRDRVMFPIVSTRGEIIGFGGRVLGAGEPKYLNSPETPVFEKGRELYGLFQARRAIREADRVIVVEGYMDVVALAQHGVANAVATLGTATTPFHVQKLLRQADHVTFCFDGDAAGRRAAWRALETSLQALTDGKHVNFLFLPDKEDPDSFIRTRGREAFEEMVERAEPLSAFLLRELKSGLDMATPEDRAEFLKKAEALLSQITARNLALAMRDAVARAAGVSSASLPEPAQRLVQAQAGPSRRSNTSRASLLNNLPDRALEALVARPDLHPLAGRAAAAADGSGCWPMVGDLAGRVAAGELSPSPQALVQWLVDGGNDGLAQRVQEQLMKRDDDYAYEDDLAAIAERLEKQRKFNQQLAAARQVQRPSDLPPEARALFASGSTPAESA
jgi:DNA primase